MAEFTAATQSLITLASVLGLRPQVSPAARGVVVVVLNGQGAEAGFGAIYVGARSGKVLRMHLRLGNEDRRPSRYVTHEGYLRAFHTLRDSYALYARCLPEPEAAPVVTSGRAAWGQAA